MNKKTIALMFSLIFLSAACVSGKKIKHTIPEVGSGVESVPNSSNGKGDGGTYGPEMTQQEPNESADSSSGASGDSEVASQEQELEIAPLDGAAAAGGKWVLVVGPGLGRSSALVGVLSDLEKRKVEIAAIVATEFGAFWSVLYAQSKNANEFIWRAKKISESYFAKMTDHLLERNREKENRDGISEWKKKIQQKRINDQFENLFQDIFKNATFKELRIPVYIALNQLGTRQVVYLKEGKIKEILRCALGHEGMLSPCERGDALFRAADMTEPLPIAFARKLEIGRILAVDFLTDHEGLENLSRDTQTERDYISLYPAIRKRLEYADQILAPKFGDLRVFDFSKRTQTEFRGRLEVERLLPSLK